MIRLPLLAVPLLLVGLVAAQDSRPPGTLAPPSQPEQADQEISDAELNARLLEEEAVFAPVEARWTNASTGYLLECRELREAGARPSEYPPHPVHEYFPVFQALSEDGNGPASQWVLRTAPEVIEDEDERLAFQKKLLLRLANDHASGEYVKDTLDDLRRLRRRLGEEFTLDVLHRIQNNSRRRSTIADAFLAEANLLVAKEGVKDPERRARAAEIWRILVDGYPGTKAAKFAGSPLMNELIEGMRQTQLAWARRVLELQASGGGTDGLPPLPGLEGQTLMATIAGAGHPIAMRWTNRFYPTMEQALRESLADAVAFELSWLWRQYNADSALWNELRYAMLEVLYEAYPDSEAAASTLVDIDKRYDTCVVEETVAVVERLASNATNPRTVVDAKLTMAQLLTRSQNPAGLERAAALFAEAEAAAVDLEQRGRAREAGLRHSWTMPGAFSPAFETLDTERTPVTSASYRGKVLLLYFWALDVPGSKEHLAFVREFVEHYADRPVAVLGIGCQTMDARMYRKAVAQHGINWRNCLMQKRRNELAAEYGVLEFPHAFVIDAEGVIRGRALSDEATYTLVDELLEEQRRSQAAAVDAGGVTGRVSYAGKAGPLPPLVFPDGAERECGGRDRELDRADRTRLVSKERGLANVVLTVRAEGRVARGDGGRARLEGVGCRFEPHVTVVPVDTRLAVANADQAPRNVQAKSRNNGSFNVALPPGVDYAVDLDVPDRFQVTSDTHPWMSAWVVVTDAPFYAVTDRDGRFTMTGLPPGRYTAEWWHESLGKGESAPFEVPAKGTARLELAVGGEPEKGDGR